MAVLVEIRCDWLKHFGAGFVFKFILKFIATLHDRFFVFIDLTDAFGCLIAFETTKFPLAIVAHRFRFDCFVNIFVVHSFVLFQQRSGSKFRYTLVTREWCCNLCELRYNFLLYPFPHTSHEKGFSPVCCNLCDCTWQFLVNRIPQISQAKRLSPSACVISSCF